MSNTPRTDACKTFDSIALCEKLEVELTQACLREQTEIEDYKYQKARADEYILRLTSEMGKLAEHRDKLAALVGIIRGMLDVPIRNVSDITPEEHSREIGAAIEAIKTELDNAESDAKQSEVDSLRALGERNECRAHLSRLPNELAMLRHTVEGSKEFQHGWKAAIDTVFNILPR